MGRRLYGDPCRGCGFSWELSMDEAVRCVSEAPGSYRMTLVGATGQERHSELSWPVVAYVCHVGDNLRIWAERLVGSVRGGGPTVAAYDENALAAARGYPSISLPAALWSLSRSVEEWCEAVRECTRTGARTDAVLVHPERGPQSLGDVTKANAHDTFHHGWDIRRSVDDAPAL